LLITNSLPRRLTSWDPGWFFRDLIDARTFMWCSFHYWEPFSLRYSGLRIFPIRKVRSVVKVVGIVGVCAQERRRYARRLAAAHRWPIVEALRSVPPSRLAESLSAAVAGGALAPTLLFDAGDRWDAPELIGALGEGGTAGDDAARLAQLVAVVDVAHLFDDLEAGPRGERLVQDIEFASTVVLVNWQPLATSDLSMVMALVNHLAPHARLRPDQPAANLDLDLGAVRREQDGAGWTKLINGTFTPYMTDPRVGGFVYENVRPFHAGRLADGLEGDIGHGRYGRLVRSAGFCALASRPGRVAQWSQVGPIVGIEPLPLPDFSPLGASPPLAVGQELAVIGLDLDRPGLTRALDVCVLTDRELAEGPLAWMAYRDPLPEWDSVEVRRE
jgi:hypothetical protein